MGVVFEITLHNVPQRVLTNAVFKRDFIKRVQRLLSDYQLDNDLEGNEIEAYITDEPSEDKEVFIMCAKRADENSFNELELELMNEIADLLAELVEQYKKSRRKGKKHR